MSNDLVSQPLTISDCQASRGSSVIRKMDPSAPNFIGGALRTFNDNPSLQYLSSSVADDVKMESALASQDMVSSNKYLGRLDPVAQNGVMHQSYLPNGQAGHMQFVQIDSGQQRLSSANKRKALGDVSTSDKKNMQAGSSHASSGMPQGSGPPNKKVALNSSLIVNSGKKVAPIETVMRKSQAPVPKNRNVPQEPSPKGKPEVIDSVRSKLRESLASALALVSQEQQVSSDAETEKESAKLSSEVSELKPTDSAPISADSTKLGQNTGTPSLSCHQTEGGYDVENGSQATDSKDSFEDSGQTWKFVGQEFLSHPVDASFSDSFFGKDDLLLGNGLTWAFDLDMGVDGLKDAEPAPILVMKDASGNCEMQVVQSPESVALSIESELFKLFGDVNKKYKEKGRSLVFNLKDRNNPELRARVMSGEISPERLCSMTAEELASKELSEWRSAKAEQLAQMKILPDSDANARPLVKKTHKGEYQVEVEHDIAAPVEPLVNASLPAVNRSRNDETEAKSSPKEKLASKTGKTENAVDGPEERRKSEDQENQERITIPSDGADLMQGLMVDDMKDLPPILSLDEFMDSLDKEPPFENLPVDSGKTVPVSNNDSSESGSGAKPAKRVLKDAAPLPAPVSRSEEVNNEGKKSDKEKPVTSGKLPETRPPDIPKKKHVWEGGLQLSISATVDVLGLYKSGEKAATKDWPRQFEIKGRVRLDAFEKFLHDLPMSRSRAIMVAHFVLRDGSDGEQRTSLFEVVDSYIQDQRVGFAEPITGFEVYFCPPHTGTLEMLRKHLSKEYTESVKAIETGLIGIVVWRKAHFTHHAVSPKSSHEHKDNAKRLPPQNSRPHEKDFNKNSNFGSRTVPIPVPVPVPSLAKPASVDDDDDAPPGFGPPVSRDEDDLPEFKFTGGSNLSGPHLPCQNPSRERPTPNPTNKVEQMRELIQKYGQNSSNVGTGIALQPWNDDDDEDDIPEWQPQPPQRQLPASLQTHGISRHEPTQPLHISNHAQLQSHLAPLARPMLPLQQPMNVQSQGWWPQPHGVAPVVQPNNLVGQPPVSGHQYRSGMVNNNIAGRDWRSNVPSSRGF